MFPARIFAAFLISRRNISMGLYVGRSAMRPRASPTRIAHCGGCPILLFLIRMEIQAMPNALSSLPKFPFRFLVVFLLSGYKFAPYLKRPTCLALGVMGG